MAQDKKKEVNILPEDVLNEEPQETVGELLRKTRLAKKQDLRDIASYLCIRYQFLEALEENRYKDLPGEAYANGFIRSYAAYLGLDSADVLMRYKQEFFAQTKKEKRSLGMSEEETENITPAPKVLLFSLILLLVAYGFWQSFSQKEEVLPVVEENAVDAIAVVEDAYPMPENADQPEMLSDANAVSDIKTENVVPPVPPVKPEYQEPATVETVKEPEQINPAVEQPAETEPVRTVRVYGQKNYNARLVLVAVEETWIEISRNGEIVFSRLLNKGDRYQVSSVRPEELFLKTGNAGGLEIYLDGVLAQPLGPRGALRSNVSLIPDNFTAKAVENAEQVKNENV